MKFASAATLLVVLSTCFPTFITTEVELHEGGGEFHRVLGRKHREHQQELTSTHTARISEVIVAPSPTLTTATVFNPTAPLQKPALTVTAIAAPPSEFQPSSGETASAPPARELKPAATVVMATCFKAFSKTKQKTIQETK
jgi:hypothetical protein